jgi:hypothetical protein
MKKLPYKEGDVFAVPLGDGSFGIGLVARAPKRGRILLGYFFGNRFTHVPAEQELPELTPQNALKVIRFGDLSLFESEWPNITHLVNFNRADWPIPKFVRRNPFSQRGWLVTYDDNDPSAQVEEVLGDFGTSEYETDELYGAGAVEFMLAEVLAHGQDAANRNSGSSGAASNTSKTADTPNADWLINPLESDDAADWIAELIKTTDLSLIDNTLSHILVGHDYLEAPDAAKGIAAAETVATLLGKPTSGDSEFRELLGWAANVNLRPNSNLIEKARSVVERVLADSSELRELWEETDDFEIWESAVLDLRARLTP